jgi:regulator of replication initiation timing
MGKLENKPKGRTKAMPKNLHKEKLEQLITKLDEARDSDTQRLKGRLYIMEEENHKLTIENASLRERLRLVEIAARGE